MKFTLGVLSPMSSDEVAAFILQASAAAKWLKPWLAASRVLVGVELHLHAITMTAQAPFFYGPCAECCDDAGELDGVLSFGLE